ncbi:MAG: YceI family protein [Omnitrophica WOR_2 bacterium]|jgi:polyisoprenoid-binding protein YceI
MDEKIKWDLDLAHTNIEFRVKHLMITNVKGKFKVYTLDASTIGNDFTTVKIEFKIDANSIDTGSDERDNHLRSADFFNVEKFKEILFHSTDMELIATDIYKLKGDLTICGNTHPIVLEAEYNGSMTDPWGVMKAGFSLTGALNRKDWGLNWNTALESGGWLVGDDVKIICDVQLKKSIEK